MAGLHHSDLPDGVDNTPGLEVSGRWIVGRLQNKICSASLCVPCMSHPITTASYVLSRLLLVSFSRFLLPTARTLAELNVLDWKSSGSERIQLWRSIASKQNTRKPAMVTAEP